MMRGTKIAGAAYLAMAYGFVFLPVVVLVLFSFHDGRLPVPPFAGPTLRWYEQLLGNHRLVGSLWNSITVAILSSLVTTVLGFLAAYGLARGSWRRPGLLRALLMAPIAVSYLIIGLGLLIATSAVGLPRSLFTVGLGHVVINLPVAFAILYAQLGAHQANIEQAARDLGAREWQVILLITAPMVWPGLVAAFCMSASFSWDEFIIAFLLSRFDVTLPVEIWSMLRKGLSPEMNAAATVVFVISFVLLTMLEIALSRGRKRS